MTGTLPSLLATGVNGVVCVIFTIPALLFIDKLGRRKTILSGSIGMGTSMLIAGALLRGNSNFFHTYDYATNLIIVRLICFSFYCDKVYPYVEGGENNTQAQYGAVAMMFIFSASFSMSWGVSKLTYYYYIQ